MINEVLERENMRRAWEQVQSNKGAPGVDRVTLKRWRRNWEANLERLRQQVKANTYRANRPKRFKVLKRDGSYRELSILTVTDRVLQRATLNVLEDRFERRFLNCSFGYRPRRSVANAITALVRHRERGKHWVLDADIEKCFDNLHHGVIMELLGQVVSDAIILRLMEMWLRAGKKASSPFPNTAEGRQGVRGVPMGAVISPLLCNVVLHELDAAVTRAGWTLIRYADDFVVLTGSAADTDAAREAVESALTRLCLRLNEAKTRVTSFYEGFRFLGVDFLGRKYSYVYREKRVVVEGPTTRLLYKYRPEYY